MALHGFFAISGTRVGYVAVGLVQGLALVGTNTLSGLYWPLGPAAWEASPRDLARPLECGLMLALTLSPWLAMLAWERGRRVLVACVAGLLAVATAGLVSHALAQMMGRGDGVFVWSLASAVVVHVAALALLVDPPGPGRWLPVSIAIPVLRALLTLALGGLFAGVVILTLWLWGALFELIGLDILEDLFDEGEILIPIATATTGFAIALVHERRRLGETLADLFVLGARYLGAVVAAAVMLFVVSLPFTGLTALWNTNHTTVMLVTVTLAILIAAFLNTERSGEGDDCIARPLLWLYALTLALLPGLAGLAVYAVWLRVDQYGLTPERVLAMVLAQVVLVKTIWALAAVLLGRGDWRSWLPRGTAPLVGLSLLAALAVLSPLADPWAVSARNQTARLFDGRVDAEVFDYGYLKFRLGEHGKQALARIAAAENIADRALVAKQLEYLAEATSYYNWKNELRAVEHRELLQGDLLAQIRPWPPGVEVPADLLAQLRRKQVNALVWCLKPNARHRPCRFIVADMDQDPEMEVIFVSLGSGGVRLYDRTKDGWTDCSPNSGFSYAKVRKALEAERIDVQARIVHDLYLGDERISFPPPRK